jgi:FkbM family methyltransferase
VDRRAALLALIALCSCRRNTHARASAPPPPSRYVFVDGGAHTGETLLAFEKSTLFTKHPWTLVSFEPNPELVAQIPKRPWASLRQEAIWTTDGELEFQFSDEQTLGGSVVDSVVKFPTMKNVKVRSVDFGHWLKTNFKKSDVVYVKFDIEGAEYPVLEQMLHDGSMQLVDRFYIEFHGAQQAEAAKKSAYEIDMVKKHDHELVQAITGLGVAVSLHLTHEPQGSYFDFNPEKWNQKW